MYTRPSFMYIVRAALLETRLAPDVTVSVTLLRACIPRETPDSRTQRPAGRSELATPEAGAQAHHAEHLHATRRHAVLRPADRGTV
jgi:hypothetical protein